jgi:hypothetical protein
MQNQCKINWKATMGGKSRKEKPRERWKDEIEED